MLPSLALILYGEHIKHDSVYEDTIIQCYHSLNFTTTTTDKETVLKHRRTMIVVVRFEYIIVNDYNQD